MTVLPNGSRTTVVMNGGGGDFLNDSLPRFAECISHTKVTKQDKHTVYSNPMMTMDVLLKI